MADEPAPLILCMESAAGEEIALQIEPDDNVETFLAKAKSILGFDVDINSITNNQPISLTDNIYNYLINAEEAVAEEDVAEEAVAEEAVAEDEQSQNADQMDGTIEYLELIEEEPEHIPEQEPEYKEEHLHEQEPDIEQQEEQLEDNMEYEYLEVKEEPKPARTETSYAPSVPFKLVPNENRVNFASQFNDFVAKKKKIVDMAKESFEKDQDKKAKKSARVKRNLSVSDEELSNFKDEKCLKAAYTREEILDILVDEPIEKRPAVTGETNKRKPNYTKKHLSRCICFLCEKYLEPHLRHYLFDKNDQIQMKSHDKRKKMNLSPNIVCEDCLNKEFDLYRKVVGEHELLADEYLIIKEKAQLIYKKRIKKDFSPRNIAKKEKTALSKLSCNQNNSIPKKLTQSAIEKIVSEPVDSATAKPQVFFQTISSDSVTNVDQYLRILSDGNRSSSDVEDLTSTRNRNSKKIKNEENSSGEDEIKEEDVRLEDIDDDFGEVEYLDSTEDQVLSFLGKTPKSLIDSPAVDEDFVCRFCNVQHAHLASAITHSLKHKHGNVYPCTLCEDGYEMFSMLRDHMRVSHKVKHVAPSVPKAAPPRRNRGRQKRSIADDTSFQASPTPKKAAGNQINKKTYGRQTQTKKQIDDQTTEEELEALGTVLKKELSDEEDEGIWIVQTDDNEVDEDLYRTILENHMNKEDKNGDEFLEKPKANQCHKCRCRFATVGQLTGHNCQKKVMENSESAEEQKPNTPQRAKRSGDLYHSEGILDDEETFDMEMEEEWIAEEEGLLPGEGRRRPRCPKVKKETTSEATVVTCHHCNVSFTSKVRLKFHMQYHGGKCADGELIAHLACHVCAAGATIFRTEAELYDHVHFAHEKRRPFMCKVDGCQKEFYLRATLTKHMRTHTDTRRYRCQQCGKRFLDKQTLDEHSVTHLDNKPFQCHICWKQLTRRSRLRMHLRAHEAEIRANLVLVCRVCDRAFRDHSAATEHSKLSTECKETLDQEFLSVSCAELDHQVRNELQDKLTALCGDIVPGSGNNMQLDPQVKRSNMDHLLPTDASHRPRALKILFEPTIVTDDQAKIIDQIPEEARALIKIVEIEKAFRCEYCEDVFYLEQALNEHRHAHRGQTKPFKCHVCNVGFSSYSRCTTHKTTHGFYKKALGDAGDDEESWTGPSAAGIVGYEDFPVVKHFLCECCCRSYLHWTYLHVHRRMKHSTPSTNMRACRDCDEKFPNSWSLAYHRRRQHNGNIVPQRQRQERDVRPTYCSECPLTFNSKSALHKHRRLQHDLGEPRSTTRGHGFLSCAVCSRQYASKAGLESHVRAHIPPAPIAPYACARCGKAFTGAAALMTHVKVVHARELEFSCVICTRRFCTRSSLAAHRKTHIQDKPYACPVCGHAFRTHSMCAEHVRIHTDERPFPCDVCGVAFRRSAAMRNHRLIHTGERAFPCLRCHKRFRIRSDLKTHMKIKHPGQIVVLEVGGLNPNPEQVLEQLALNNIAPEKIVDISKISVAGGTVSEAAALFAEGEEALFGQGADVAWGGDMMKVIRSQGGAKPEMQSLSDTEGMYRRGRGIARQSRNFVSKLEQDENITSEASQHILYAVDEHGNHIQIDSAQLEALCGAGAFDTSEYCVMVKDENEEEGQGEGEQVLLSQHQQLITEHNGDLVQLVDEEGRLVMIEPDSMMDQVYQLRYQDMEYQQYQKYNEEDTEMHCQNNTEKCQSGKDVEKNFHSVVIQEIEN